MRTIWKYPLFYGERKQYLKIPTAHEALTVQLQRGIPMLWCMVNDSYGLADVAIYCLPTGGEGPAPEWQYLGTVQMPDGSVWHYFK